MAERIFRVLSLLTLGLGLAASFASVDATTTPETMVSSAESTISELQALHEAEQINALLGPIRHVQGDQNEVATTAMYNGSLFAVTKK